MTEVWANKTACSKEPAATPDKLSLIPRIHDRRTLTPQGCSLTASCMLLCVHMNAHEHVCCRTYDHTVKPEIALLTGKTVSSVVWLSPRTHLDYCKWD